MNNEIQEILEEFDKEFPNAVWADLTLHGLTTAYNASNDIKTFLEAKLQEAYQKGREENISYKQGYIRMGTMAWELVLRSGDKEAIKIVQSITDEVTTLSQKQTEEKDVYSDPNLEGRL